GRVTVGDAHNAQNVRGPVTVTNNHLLQYTTLDVDDGATNAFGTTVTVSDAAVTGLAPADINYRATDIDALPVEAGGDLRTIKAVSTSNHGFFLQLRDVTTDISSKGNDTVNLGSAGDLRALKGPVHIANSGVGTTLNADDSADPTARDVTVSGTTVHRLAPADITFDADGLGSLNLTGSAHTAFTVQDTPDYSSFSILSLPTTIHNHAGVVSVFGTTGTLNVDSSGPSARVAVGDHGDMTRVRGDVTVTGSTSNLTADDSADTAGRTVTMRPFL